MVEDDAKMADLIRLYLERDGYRVFVANDGQAALDLAGKLQPSLIVLDLMLPGVDGMSVCRTLRAGSSVPILMVTARSIEDDKLTGLEWGADDYITKPFSPHELVARVRVVLRRSGATRRLAALRGGDLYVDFSRYEASLYH